MKRTLQRWHRGGADGVEFQELSAINVDPFLEIKPLFLHCVTQVLQHDLLTVARVGEEPILHCVEITPMTAAVASAAEGAVTLATFVFFRSTNDPKTQLRELCFAMRLTAVFLQGVGQHRFA
eukprot:CAMPEP_0175849940 /NCGR_PEP_ID=MMETSP0107_2-20121207/24807_1 /TAXON_ID=195067 ORGANISM="Goniomonas pacifica, Strain CCMP1869" /NCGR_SAMPLE_ID=MMETSP0107_2 /ASSEMBLY_ACC=CAM_ASM_000203 /LENGTH=121 /DNA_ID=CAMNT_0017165161 /DNA_START=341 /DNA_END=702 /DNA_ORIENTATION=-